MFTSTSTSNPTEQRPQQRTAPAPATDAAWRTPSYTVVETALEVTGYSLITR
ncbi:pyrroloquinoline quinone precursor peptide PqqA [Streptomyces sp. CBMA29]|uniref:pyrroloquinoline quinone precursor peptide PqqA n=1 Tax=Streptomyces sp. CBMA29 TaxID=1896314 RepID=UPI001661FF48|nr:pyrroloquinoline quinone precursor peptide PqqA [Streptomyces sp. CBMA29]